MDNQSHSILTRIVSPLLGIMLAVAPGINPVAVAQDITYDNFDVEEFRYSYDQVTPPDITTEDILRFERALEDAIRGTETQEVADKLKAAAEHWRSLSKQLDEELEAVARQERRDAKVRSVATFFHLVAAAASVVDAFASKAPTPADQAPTDSTPSPAGLHTPAGLHIQEQYQRTINFCEDGTCQPIEIQQMKMESIINEAIMPSGGAEDSAIHHMRSKLNQSADKFPSVLCDLGGERCAPLNVPTVRPVATSPGAPSSTPSPRIIEPPSSSLKEQKSLFEAVKPFLRPAASFGADALLGTPKSVIEVVTGKDPITGEQVSKGLAALGIVAGVVPGGKAVLKGTGKIFRFRHYTNRRGAREIESQGVIKGGSKNKVYAERVAGSTKKPLSRIEAQETYGLKQGRGSHRVEFDLPPNKTASKQYNRQTKAYEWTIEGDVRLGPNTKFIEGN